MNTPRSWEMSKLYAPIASKKLLEALGTKNEVFFWPVVVLKIFHSLILRPRSEKYESPSSPG